MVGTAERSDRMLGLADACSSIWSRLGVVVSAAARERVPKPAPRATPPATATFQLSLLGLDFILLFLLLGSVDASDPRDGR